MTVQEKLASINQAIMQGKSNPALTARQVPDFWPRLAGAGVEPYASWSKADAAAAIEAGDLAKEWECVVDDLRSDARYLIRNALIRGEMSPEAAARGYQAFR